MTSLEELRALSEEAVAMAIINGLSALHELPNKVHQSLRLGNGVDVLARAILTLWPSAPAQSEEAGLRETIAQKAKEVLMMFDEDGIDYSIVNMNGDVVFGREDFEAVTLLPRPNRSDEHG